jgi:hypothetical protein
MELVQVPLMKSTSPTVPILEVVKLHPKADTLDPLAMLTKLMVE